MSAPPANLHSARAPTEAERGPRLPDVEAAQQLKLRERQRFFEEVFQHDVDAYLSSAHLCIRDYKRPPIGSVSSMEVNVDLLDQIDISDHEALDVFFSCEGEDGALTPPLPVQGISNNNNDDDDEDDDEVIRNGLFGHVLEGLDAKSRMSSTSSSSSSSDSQTSNANGGDDGGTHTGTIKRRAVPPETERVKGQTPSS